MVVGLSLREAWRVAVVAIISLFLLVLVLYQQTVFYLIGLWNQLGSGDYGHGYLVLLISAYLIFYNRNKLVTLTPCPEYRALLAVIFAVMLWLVASLVDIEALQSVALLLLIISIMWATLGSRVIWILAFPLFYIGFAIPVWFPLSPVLQDITADAVFWIIRFMEIPAMREENVIVLPAGKMFIEEACSGLRYLLASLTLGALYAYLNFRRLRSRLIVLSIAAGAALLANILRVLIVVYLGYKTDMQHPLVTDHLSLGWYLFAGVVVVLLFVDAGLYKVYQQTVNPDNTAEAGVIKPGQCNKSRTMTIGHVLLAACLVAVAPVSLYWLNEQATADIDPSQYNLVFTAGEWSALPAAGDDWNPGYNGAISQKMTFQDRSGRQIYLYLGIYPTQKQGEELINDLNQIADEKIWRLKYQKEKQLNSAGQQVLEQILERHDGEQRLVWYWYRVAGQVTINKYQAKLLQVFGLLQGKQQASVIAIATELNDEIIQARAVLTRFSGQVGPVLDKIADGRE